GMVPAGGRWSTPQSCRTHRRYWFDGSVGGPAHRALPRPALPLPRPSAPRARRGSPARPARPRARVVPLLQLPVAHDGPRRVRPGGLEARTRPRARGHRHRLERLRRPPLAGAAAVRSPLPAGGNTAVAVPRPGDRVRDRVPRGAFAP